MLTKQVVDFRRSCCRARASEIMDKRRALIWNYFNIQSNQSTHAKCNVSSCQQAIKRGQNPSSYSTTPLVNHLRSKHRNLFEQYEAALSQPGTSIVQNLPANQPSILSAFEDVRVWPHDNSKARKITRKVAEMIALDVQPISIVEDSGFKELLTTIEPRYCLPSRPYIRNEIDLLFTEVKTKMKELIAGEFISVTTDIWTSQVNNMCFLSLTCCFVNTDYVRKVLVLNTSPFPGTHSGVNIAEKLQNLVNDWEIPVGKIFFCVSDNASNMKNAITTFGVKWAGCSAHTIQLCVNDAITSQKKRNRLNSNFSEILVLLHDNLPLLK